MAGLTYDGISSTEIDSTILSGTSHLGDTGSFATGIRALNFVSPGSITDAQGRLRSTVIGSATATVYGGWLQVGSAATSAGSVGFVELGQPMSTANYRTIFAGVGYVAGVGSVSAWESGTKSTSGVSFIGAASTTYNWLAIGT